jgi:hypothetical protein
MVYTFTIFLEDFTPKVHTRHIWRIMIVDSTVFY